MANEIIAEVASKGEEIAEQIEEVNRIGMYDKNGTRPVKIRFMSQTCLVKNREIGKSRRDEGNMDKK